MAASTTALPGQDRGSINDNEGKEEVGIPPRVCRVKEGGRMKIGGLYIGPAHAARRNISVVCWLAGLNE